MEDFVDSFIAYCSNANSDDMEKAFGMLKGRVQCPQISLYELLADREMADWKVLAVHRLQLVPNMLNEFIQVCSKITSNDSLFGALNVFVDAACAEEKARYVKYRENCEKIKDYKCDLTNIDVYKYLTKDYYSSYVIKYLKSNMALPEGIGNMNDIELKTTFIFNLVSTFRPHHYKRFYTSIKAYKDELLESQEQVLNLLNKEGSYKSKLLAILINNIENIEFKNRLCAISKLNQYIKTLNCKTLVYDAVQTLCQDTTTLSEEDASINKNYSYTGYFSDGPFLLTRKEIERVITDYNCYAIIKMNIITPTEAYDILTIKSVANNNTDAQYKKLISPACVEFIASKYSIFIHPKYIKDPIQLQSYYVY
jgi:hypothetical protein